MEGAGRQTESNKEYVRYVTMALGSTEECKLWVRYCVDLRYLKQDSAQRFYRDYKEVARMLQGLKKQLSAN